MRTYILIRICIYVAREGVTNKIPLFICCWARTLRHHHPPFSTRPFQQGIERKRKRERQARGPSPTRSFSLSQLTLEIIIIIRRRGEEGKSLTPLKEPCEFRLLLLQMSVVDGHPNELATPSPPSKIRATSRSQKPRQQLLSQQRPPVPHLHSSPCQFLPHQSTLLSLSVVTLPHTNLSLSLYSSFLFESTTSSFLSN